MTIQQARAAGLKGAVGAAVTNLFNFMFRGVDPDLLTLPDRPGAPRLVSQRADGEHGDVHQPEEAGHLQGLAPLAFVSTFVVSRDSRHELLLVIGAGQEGLRFATTQDRRCSSVVLDNNITILALRPREASGLTHGSLHLERWQYRRTSLQELDTGFDSDGMARCTATLRRMA